MFCNKSLSNELVVDITFSDVLTDETSLLPFDNVPYFAFEDCNRFAANKAIPTTAQDPIAIKAIFVGLVLAEDRLTEPFCSFSSAAAAVFVSLNVGGAVPLTGGVITVVGAVTGADVGVAGVGASSGNFVAMLMDKLNSKRPSFINKSRNFLLTQARHTIVRLRVHYQGCSFSNVPIQTFFKN